MEFNNKKQNTIDNDQVGLQLEDHTLANLYHTTINREEMAINIRSI